MAESTITAERLRQIDRLEDAAAAYARAAEKGFGQVARADH